MFVATSTLLYNIINDINASRHEECFAELLNSIVFIDIPAFTAYFALDFLYINYFVQAKIENALLSKTLFILVAL